MFYRTRGLAAAVLLCVTTVAQAGELKVQAGSVEAVVGGEVEVPIKVTGAKGVEGVQLVLSFDDKVIENSSVEAGEIVGAAEIDTKTREAGIIRVAMYPEKTLDGDGTLLVAKFKVIGKSGSKSTIDLSEVRAWEFGAKAPLEMLVSAESGKVTVNKKGLPLNFIALIAGAVVLLLLLLLVIRRSSNKASTKQGA